MILTASSFPCPQHTRNMPSLDDQPLLPAFPSRCTPHPHNHLQCHQHHHLGQPHHRHCCHCRCPSRITIIIFSVFLSLLIISIVRIVSYLHLAFLHSSSSWSSCCSPSSLSPASSSPSSSRSSMPSWISYISKGSSICCCFASPASCSALFTSVICNQLKTFFWHRKSMTRQHPVHG